MSSDRQLTLFEVLQLMAAQTRKGLNEASAALGYDGISVPEARLIWEISTGSRNIQQLAERTGTTKQFCAREIAKLREAGFVVTKTDSVDKRAVRVMLTPKGETLLADLGAEKLRLEAEMRDRIGPEAYAQTIKTLSALLDTDTD